MAVVGLATAAAPPRRRRQPRHQRRRPERGVRRRVGSPNGDVVVTVHDLADASGLEHALAAKGIHADVTYVPGLLTVRGQARTSSGDDRAACDIALAKVDGGLRFTLGAAQIATGAELDIVTSGSSPTDVGSPVAVVWSGGGC